MDRERDRRRTVFAAIHDSAHGSLVLAQHGLVAGLEVDVPHLPVDGGAEGLAAVGAEADVHDGGAVLEGAQEGAMAGVLLFAAAARG